MFTIEISTCKNSLPQLNQRGIEVHGETDVWVTASLKLVSCTLDLARVSIANTHYLEAARWTEREKRARLGKSSLPSVKRNKDFEKDVSLVSDTREL